MKTNSFFKVKTSSYMGLFFDLVPIKHSQHPLFGFIKPDMFSTDGKFMIFIQNSANYPTLTDYFKKRKEQLRLANVDFFDDSIYDILPELLFEIADVEDNEPSDVEIGYDLNKKINFQL